MTLLELSVEYRTAARRLKERIAELQAKMKQCENDAERHRLEDRIKLLADMHRDTSDVAVLCERYYERGYRRNGEYTL